MDFGNVLSRAWQIVWKYKILWIFGILASCATGGSSNPVSYTVNGSSTSSLPWINIQDGYYFTPEIGALLISLAVLFVLALIVLAIFLGTVGRIGLIRGALQGDEGAERISFRELFSGSMPYFWRVFAINLFVGVATALVIILLAVMMVFGTIFTLGLGLLCFIPFMCLLIPAVWMVNLVLEQATNAIVIENIGVFDGLSRGWHVFRDHLGTIIAMGLILLVVNILAGFLIAAPFLALIIPFIIGITAESQGVIWTSVAIFLTCLVLYLPVLVVVNGILRSYTNTAWTLTFLRITGHKGTPKEVVSLSDPNQDLVSPA
jgi:hypothetical protein